jgi:hypothetical protein
MAFFLEMSKYFRNFAVYKLSVSPLKSVSYMVKEVNPQSGRQGSRPDPRERYAIMARKIESAYQMMAAFGRPMKHL